MIYDEHSILDFFSLVIKNTFKNLPTNVYHHWIYLVFKQFLLINTYAGSITLRLGNFCHSNSTNLSIHNDLSPLHSNNTSSQLKTAHCPSSPSPSKFARTSTRAPSSSSSSLYTSELHRHHRRRNYRDAVARSQGRSKRIDRRRIIEESEAR